MASLLLITVAEKAEEVYSIILSAALLKTFRWKKSPLLGTASSFFLSISLFAFVKEALILHGLCFG
jgi:hypothetical protein